METPVASSARTKETQQGGTASTEAQLFQWTRLREGNLDFFSASVCLCVTENGNHKFWPYSSLNPSLSLTHTHTHSLSDSHASQPHRGV